ncbi:hypothetical protein GPJ56_004182 [Histomonas meleagridis]|uniref:uncharacterized protein n=1 Tax=Histomonas meleagridis TaxID=135588 RepID=UPI00355A5906|nr:hypothetical protein GPJ56_004182 [Histomonas meleagridis]KAH0801524.1 hypothetical protein GO595_005660 [Histomonas meleagridis]
MKFNDFRNRMQKRFSLQKSFSLGELEGLTYTFNNGMITCINTKNKTPSIPKHDLSSLIGHNGFSLSPIQSPNVSGTRNDRFQPGYDPSLLLDQDGNECSFEEARLRSIGIDFVARRLAQTEVQLPPKSKRVPLQEIKKSSPISKPQFGFPEPELPPKRNRTPLQEIRKEPPSMPGPFDLPDEKPRSILKKPDQRGHQVTNTVTFGNKSAEKGPTQKRRVPTPTIKKTLAIGERLMFGGRHYNIVQQLGNSAFLCENNTSSFVLKQNPLELQPFNPQHYYLFLVKIPSVEEYYVTKYLKYGTFQDVITFSHSKPRGFDEPTSLFYLYQLLLILNDLEQNFVSHCYIDPENLLNKIPAKELPKEFNNDPSWEDVGLILCRCDKLVAHEGNIDRESVGKLYHFLCTKKMLNKLNEFDKCPKRWNEKIWNEVFRILQTQQDLNNLIELIKTELKQPSKGLQLRSSLSRINVYLMENQK